jgi:tripartite-type tricarboxylate transporter receptor subunit TctC
MNFGFPWFILGFVSLIFLATPSPSAEKPFYQGKNVNFSINFAAGGPTDIEGRIVARHLAKQYRAIRR